MEQQIEFEVHYLKLKGICTRIQLNVTINYKKEGEG